jgi:hypothetical protein
MKCRKLIHEVWEDSHADLDQTWHTEWGICLSGPFGDWFRRLLSPRARLLTRFEAGSPDEARALFDELIATRIDLECHRRRINDGLKGLVESESEPYPQWFFEEYEQPFLPDSSHPLWDREVDE